MHNEFSFGFCCKMTRKIKTVNASGPILEMAVLYSHRSVCLLGLSNLIHYEEFFSRSLNYLKFIKFFMTTRAMNSHTGREQKRFSVLLLFRSLSHPFIYSFVHFLRLYHLLNHFTFKIRIFLVFRLASPANRLFG